MWIKQIVILVFQFTKYEILVGFHCSLRMVLIPKLFRFVATSAALQPSDIIRKAMGRMRILKSLALFFRT